MKNPPEEAAMSRTYRTLRVARSDERVLGVVIDAPPMNLIGPPSSAECSIACSGASRSSKLLVSGTGSPCRKGRGDG
jgi:hypothetical protein